MAKFRFKLEPLLKHRRQVEEQKQRDLAALMQRWSAMEGELAAQQTTIRGDKRLMAGALVGRVDVGRIRQHAVHVGQVALRAQQIGIEMAKLNRQIERARADLTEAMRQRKAVELLRDRQHERWRRERDRRETAQLDELAVQAYARRGGEAAA